MPMERTPSGPPIFFFFFIQTLINHILLCQSPQKLLSSYSSNGLSISGIVYGQEDDRFLLSCIP